MKFRNRLAIALVAALSFAPMEVLAQDTPPTSGLEALFVPLSQGACIKMESVRAASTVIILTPDQFQFVRAFWAAIPPASHDLPPGDKAFYAKDSADVAVFGLVGSDGQVCAVLKATDWLQRLVTQVGTGETGHLGNPT